MQRTEKVEQGKTLKNIIKENIIEIKIKMKTEMAYHEPREGKCRQLSKLGQVPGKLKQKFDAKRATLGYVQGKLHNYKD